MPFLKFLAGIALAAALIWLVFEPSLEAAAGVAATLLATATVYLKSRGTHGKKDLSQSQSVAGGSVGIQAGGNVEVGGSVSSGGEGDGQRK